MASELLTAFALVLILEGFMPGLFPAAWRRMLRSIDDMEDHKIRWFGLGCMLAGALLLNYIN